MDNWFVGIMFVPLVLLLGGIGCALRYGRAYWLISGYNTMPEEKKKNVDIQGLARFLGLCLIVGAAVCAVALALIMLGAEWGVSLLILLLPGLVYMIIKAQKYDGNARRPDGRMSTQTKVTVVLLTVVLGGVAAGVFAMINSSAAPVSYRVTADTLEVNCTFGEKVKLADIDNLELTDERPAVASRTMGSSLGEKLRGSFALKDGSAARMFVENANAPFVQFTVRKTHYFINRQAAEETKALYEELKAALDIG